MKLGEVVKKYRQEHGLSMREFAKQCNMSRTYILMLEHGVNPKTGRALSPTVETLQRIAAGMGMTLERLTPMLDDDVMIRVNNISKGFKEPACVYPYYPESVAAGLPENIEGNTFNHNVAIPNIFLGSYAGNKSVIIMHVNGESMNKIIPNHACIAVARDIEMSSLRSGDIVVFEDNCNSFSVKRFFRSGDKLIFRPESTNPEFTDLVYSVDSGVRIIGKVQGHSIQRHSLR